MTENIIEKALQHLAEHNVDAQMKGLEELEKELPNSSEEELSEIINAINSVFYLDTYEYPEFQKVVERAVKILSTQGVRVVPHLLELLGDSDFKVEFSYALIFGKIGADAIQPLLDAYERTTSSNDRSFVIYSLGKIKDTSVKAAIPMLLRAIESESKDIRDSATRTFGKIAENVSGSEVENSMRERIFESLMTALKDHHSGVRAKACRSLGKMAKQNYLNDSQISKLKKSVEIILGRGDYTWDKAFVVRREATEVEDLLKS